MAVSTHRIVWVLSSMCTLDMLAAAETCVSDIQGESMSLLQSPSFKSGIASDQELVQDRQDEVQDEVQDENQNTTLSWDTCTITAVTSTRTHANTRSDIYFCVQSAFHGGQTPVNNNCKTHTAEIEKGERISVTFEDISNGRIPERVFIRNMGNDGWGYACVDIECTYSGGSGRTKRLDVVGDWIWETDEDGTPYHDCDSNGESYADNEFWVDGNGDAPAYQNYNLRQARYWENALPR